MGRTLEEMIADWRDVYKNLLLCKDRPHMKHNYSNFALIKVVLGTPGLIISESRWLFYSLADECTLETLEYVFSRVPPSSRAMHHAITQNNPLMIKFLLQYSDLQPNLEDIFGLVSSPDSLCSLKILLADPRYAKVDKYELFITAICSESTEVALYLLPEVDPAAQNNKAIVVAASTGDTEIVRALLCSQTVNPSVRDNCALKSAIVDGYAEVVELLLSHPRTLLPDITDLREAFGTAIKHNHSEVVRVLLADGRLDPSTYSFSNVCKKGSLEMFRVLYSDKRADWSVDRNAALRVARKLRRTEIVTLLLQDERVSAQEQKMTRRRAVLGY